MQQLLLHFKVECFISLLMSVSPMLSTLVFLLQQLQFGHSRLKPSEMHHANRTAHPQSAIAV